MLFAARRAVLAAHGLSAIRRAAPLLAVARLVRSPALRPPLLLGAGGAAGSAACCAAAAAPGYQITPSGLQIADQKVGEGESPSNGETVRVHYTGRLYENRVLGEVCSRQPPAALLFPWAIIDPSVLGDAIMTRLFSGAGLRQLDLPWRAD